LLYLVLVGTVGCGTVSDEREYFMEDLPWEEDVYEPEAEEEIPMPAYLQSHDAGDHPYGTLTYNARRKAWVISGDPGVAQMCRRLFPGTGKTQKRGTAVITNHWRFVAELNWLMLRYPLEIAEKDRKRWQQALEEARVRVARKEAWRRQPLSREPSHEFFKGELTEFQKEGLGYLLAHDRGLLADEMGLGKTVQTLACLSSLQEYPVLLVVPPHLVTNWIKEIQRFMCAQGEEGTQAPKIHVIHGLKPYELPSAHIYIIHYLLLRGWKRVLPECGFRTLVFDEIQELRRTGTEKYSAASLLAEKAERVYGLSGTPIYNRGGEIYHVMNILDYHCLGDWDSFTREWCYGYGGDVVARPQELGDHLRREGLMLRRTKENVLKELPPKRRVVQSIDSDETVFARNMQSVQSLVRKLIRLGGQDPAQEALLREQIAAGERQATGIAKASHVAAFIRALVEAGEKVLLFAYHHSVFDIYKRELASLDPVFITGREKPAAKEAAVEAFMQGRSSIACISLRAASGLNLQKATCVVFGELDWSPAIHSQAEDRAHRMGQTDSLLCYYLVCSHGSDRDMQDALGLKVSQFLGLMGAEATTPEEEGEALIAARRHIDRVIERLVAEQQE